MNRLLPLLLAISAVLLTGCPNNNYTVDLTPHGPVIERELTFFCEDGKTTNGQINYQTFSSNELAAINALYPRSSLSNDGQRHFAAGSFSGKLPDDIGGAGYYSNFPSALGSASFYSERFRGDDDQAARLDLRFHAADRLADHFLAWSKLELGSEPGYPNLRRFLDTDLRSDLKNVNLLLWRYSDDQAASSNGDTAPVADLLARLFQYLVEHHYANPGDLPAGFAQFTDNLNTDRLVTTLVRRLVVEKLGLRPGQPVPASLAFLNNPAALQASWEKYLTTTPEYRHLLWEWRKEQLASSYLNPAYAWNKVTGASSRNPAPPPKPDPNKVVEQTFADYFQIELFSSSDDVLAVNLMLPHQPLFSNGRWDDFAHKLTWKRTIEPAGKSLEWPAQFYATWAEPDAAFQNEHFGRVLVVSNDLVIYSLWSATLNPRQSQEWNDFLNGLRPGEDLLSRISSFTFSAAANSGSITNPPVPPPAFRALFNPPSP